MIDNDKLQQKSRLGTILTNRKYITESQLTQALSYQMEHDVRLGEALIELGFIDAKQLKRALRRQSWLRSIAAGVALVVAPFSPAFAASQGTLGKSSSASSQISVTILPKSVVNGNDSLKFSSTTQKQVSDPLCFNKMGLDLFSVQASGSGDKGQFLLVDQNNQSVSYQVGLSRSGQDEQTLNPQQKTSSFKSVSQTLFDCGSGQSDRLKVSLDPKAKRSQSNYAGTLTLTIVAE